MARRLSTEQIRDVYRADYLRRLKRTPTFRLTRLLPFMGLQPSDAVADFGCGDGALLGLIHKHVASYAGVDFSEEFIHAARTRLSSLGMTNATFHCTSIEEFCSRSCGEFDKAFAMDFAEHVYDEDWLSILLAIRSSLKPNGKLFLHTPNGRFFVERLKKMGVLPQLTGHIAVRDEQAHVDLLTQAGFREITTIGLPHYLPLFAWLRPLAYMPALGPFFVARLFLVATA